MLVFIASIEKQLNNDLIPRNAYMRKKFLKVFVIDRCHDWQRVCSDHFLEENYKPGKKRFLFPNAIPQPYNQNGFPSNYATQRNNVETGNNVILPMELNIIKNLAYHDECDCIESEFYREIHTGNAVVNNFKSPKRSSRLTRNNEDMSNKNMPVLMYKLTKQFTEEEQSMVLDLVKTHRLCIFSGHLFEKDEAWSNIVETFNLQQTSGTRTLDEIKYLFEHLSKTAKSQNKNDKIERFKTGGGQYKKSMNHLSEQVISVIEDRNTPLFNAHDDDYGYADPMNADRCIENDVQDDEEIVEFVDGVDEIDITADNSLPPSREFNWAMFNTETETSTLSNNSYQSPAINESNKKKNNQRYCG